MRFCFPQKYLFKCGYQLRSALMFNMLNGHKALITWVHICRDGMEITCKHLSCLECILPHKSTVTSDWKHDASQLRKAPITLSNVNWKCMSSWYLKFSRCSGHVVILWTSGVLSLKHCFQLLDQRMKHISLSLFKCSSYQTEYLN